MSNNPFARFAKSVVTFRFQNVGDELRGRLTKIGSYTFTNTDKDGSEVQTEVLQIFIQDAAGVVHKYNVTHTVAIDLLIAANPSVGDWLWITLTEKKPMRNDNGEDLGYELFMFDLKHEPGDSA